MRILCLIPPLLLFALSASGFSVRSSVVSVRPSQSPRSSSCCAFDPSSIVEPSSSIMLAEDSWRQYVPLVVIAGVLVDILLGSPLANSALKPLRGDQPQADGETGDRANQDAVSRSKERVDSDRVAQDAINRAESALELRRFLDERKTDWDKFEEQKKSLDEQMQDFDSDYQAREESFAKQLGEKKDD